MEKRRIDWITDYYRKVYGVEISETEGVAIPTTDGFTKYMVVEPGINEDYILRGLQRHFKIAVRQFTEPVSEKLVQPLGDHQRREVKLAKKTYLFAYEDREKASGFEKELHQSYYQAVRKGLQFMSLKEYLLVWGFEMFQNKTILDKVDSWTLTSSAWSKTQVVAVGWDYKNECLYVRGVSIDYVHEEFALRRVIAPE